MALAWDLPQGVTHECTRWYKRWMLCLKCFFCLLGNSVSSHKYILLQADNPYRSPFFWIRYTRTGQIPFFCRNSHRDAMSTVSSPYKYYFHSSISTKKTSRVNFSVTGKSRKGRGPLVRYNNMCRFSWINCQHWHRVLQLAVCDEWYPVALERAAAARQHGWLRALLTGWWIRKLKRDSECGSWSGKCFHLSLLWSSFFHLYRTF